MMKSVSILATALLASIPAFAATGTSSSSASTTTPTGVEEPSANPTIDVPVVQGCYYDIGTMKKIGVLPFNSKSKCAQETCYAQKYPVAATLAGNECFCGDKMPPPAALVDDSHCNIGCTGYDQQACGGFNSTTNMYYYTVYNTGISLAVESQPDSILPQSSSSSSSTMATSTAAPASTVYVSGTTSASSPTATPTDSSTKSGGKSNTVGIAVGVVVGVLAVAAIAGGLFFFMRRKRAQELDEKTRHDAVISNFFGGASPSSISDSRVDPAMSQRRYSNGSIADNQDYSRKILRVTNA